MYLGKTLFSQLIDFLPLYRTRFPGHKCVSCGGPD